MKKEKKQIKRLLSVYVFALIVSGFTAMIVPQGLRFLIDKVPIGWTAIHQWLIEIYGHILSVSHHVFYGFDWLAFAHYMIAASFLGVWKDPVKNRWVVEWAMITSIAIFPFAFIMGFIREIPFWWQLIDCSFGVFSLILLIMIDRRIAVIKREEELEDRMTLKYF